MCSTPRERTVFLQTVHYRLQACTGQRTGLPPVHSRFLSSSPGTGQPRKVFAKHLLPTTRRNEHVRHHTVFRIPRPPPRREGA